MMNPALDVADDPSGIALIPSSVKRLGGDAELDDEFVAAVLGLSLAALFFPQPDERRFVRAHDDPGVRSADELAAVLRLSCENLEFHGFLQQRK
jgi:hypothetical protein